MQLSILRIRLGLPKAAPISRNMHTSDRAFLATVGLGACYWPRVLSNGLLFLRAFMTYLDGVFRLLVGCTLSAFRLVVGSALEGVFRLPPCGRLGRLHPVFR